MAYGDTVITIVGRLTADPQIRTVQGRTVADMTIASTSRRRNSQSGQFEDAGTLFLRASAWDSQNNPLASNCGVLTKGMKVITQGVLTTRQWQDKQTGQNRSTVELRVSEIGPCLSDNQVSATRIAHGQGGFQQSQQQPQYQQPQQQSYTQGQGGYQPVQQTDPWAGQFDNPEF